MRVAGLEHTAPLRFPLNYCNDWQPPVPRHSCQSSNFGLRPFCLTELIEENAALMATLHSAAGKKKKDTAP